MHYELLKSITGEIRNALTGGILTKVFQLSRTSIVMAFRGSQNQSLFISTEPSAPRLYLLTRTNKELEKQSQPPSEFVHVLRTELAGGTLTSIQLDESDRIVRLSFTVPDVPGGMIHPTVVAQLTGRSANLFLLDDDRQIIHVQKSRPGREQQTGDTYEAPTPNPAETASAPVFEKGAFETLSAAVENHYDELTKSRLFDNRAGLGRSKLRQDISRLEKLRAHLEQDLIAQGDADKHKLTGDLLLASITTAERDGDKVRLRDFYAPDEPIVEIKVDENKSLQAAAAEFFAKYGKAKRGARQISERLKEIAIKLDEMRRQQSALEEIISERDADALQAELLRINPPRKKAPLPKSGKEAEKIPGVRRYLSSDGFEILVGRAAKDNDNLTFRIGRAQDLWLHAADYPGSHVIVKNPSRKEVPHRTIIEAAQLAAKFSQAGDDSKVNVNYSQQKFVSRIKGAAPGLVRLASFRTLTVEPKEDV
ncbi:MAG TPA: NFACT family protein, partial [Pyrinomonadaceae bacterium]|nr:NFACT family protein [Pyrinomonadaceae bacterium]